MGGDWSASRSSLFTSVSIEWQAGHATVSVWIILTEDALKTADNRVSLYTDWAIPAFSPETAHFKMSSLTSRAHNGGGKIPGAWTSGPLNFLRWRLIVVGRSSSVSIATCYRLDGPGIESQWRRDFSHPSIPALGPTQPPIQYVSGLSRG